MIVVNRETGCRTERQGCDLATIRQYEFSKSGQGPKRVMMENVSPTAFLIRLCSERVNHHNHNLLTEKKFS